MKALFMGSDRWGDSYMLDLIIGGLKESNKGLPSERVEVCVYESDETGAAHRDRVFGESSRHPGTFLVPLVGTPNVVFVLHDGLPQDADSLERIAHWLEQGIPVYHIRHMDRLTVQRLRRANKAKVPVAPKRSVRRKINHGPTV